MSSAITITITANRGEQLPTRGQIQQVASTVGFDLDSCDDYSVIRLQPTSTPYIAIQWYDQRWGVDDSLSFCQDLTEAFPELLIRHLDEWDGHDEDEAGAEGFEWLGGRMIRRGSNEFIWRDVTPVTQ